MRILLTGHKGFVGRHVHDALAKDHELMVIDRPSTFQLWCDTIETLALQAEAVVHIGAVAENQTQDPSIFLWNSYGTFLLAECVRKAQGYFGSAPFIFFSSNLVGETEGDWDRRSAYTQSKAMAEAFVKSELTGATILRPGTIWGDGEERKQHKHRSAPYQLAAHELKYLFRDYRRYYVHVSDIVEAVKVALMNRPRGTFSLYEPTLVSTQDLVQHTTYRGFEWIDDPHKHGYYDILPDMAKPNMPPLPQWEARITVKDELPRLERALTVEA